MKLSVMPTEVWIGLIKVRQRRKGPLGDADLAYTNAVGLASNKRQFRRLLDRTLREMDMKLLRLENPEPLKSRRAQYTVHQRILKAARTLDARSPVAFGTFYTFDE